MATSKEYMEFILGQLSELEGITHRAMMGEYIIYYKGRIAAYVCDDRLLMPSAVYEPPYEGAKDMLLVDNVDDREYLTGLFNAVYDELSEPKPKKKK